MITWEGDLMMGGLLGVPMSGTAADEDAEHADEDVREDVDTSHLDDIDDGCGCAEVWEHLSEERDSNA